MKLDVIIPLFNEEGNVEVLYNSINTILNDIKYNIIFVDDGSTDNTLNILKYIYKSDEKHVKVLSFSRNFGKDAAIHAGILESNAEYACIVDGDMQHNPKYIKDMLEYIEKHKEYDIVCMTNNYKDDSLLQKIGKHTFYKLMKAASKQEYVAGASDFRLMSKKVVNSLKTMNENNRFTKGLFSYVGFKTYYITYKPDKRLSGKTKFNLRKQISYALDGIFNFSTLPLRFTSFVGGLISFASFIYLLVVVIKTLIQGKDIPGYASMMSIILMLGGLILFVLGIIGEYVSKTYMEIKNRPIYILKERLGFDDKLL